MRVRVLTASLLLLLAACQVPFANVQTQNPAHLTHGPLAGGVTDTSANLWVRTNEGARVQIEYSADASLQNAQTSAPQTTNVESDFTTIAQISNLAPQTEYFYNVRINDVPQFTAPYPRFQTFASRGDKTPFRFLLLSDFRTVSRITQQVDTFPHAAAEQPAFVILGGDFDHRNPETLDAKREMFRDLYTSAGGMEDFVKQILSNFALVHFWDDHDYGDNNTDKTYPHKTLSLQVLQEYFPLYPIPAQGDWQSFAYGDADFFVLDARSQRDPPKSPNGPEKSMLDGDDLGADGQLAWLFDGLKNSTATWKFIVSPVIFNPTTKKRDGWGAYPDERAKILEYIRANGITGVIILSGDLHAGAIDDGTNSGLPELVVPTANDGFDKRCLTEPTGDVGVWSVGNYGDASGAPCNGYAVVTVEDARVVLEVKDSQGATKLEYTVE
ncbi:MAG: alkaline phosphatase D family protein [Anaerolineae bacterium]|nr:alkaline phosphatase D family protein [Anaerolineae bacterium]